MNGSTASVTVNRLRLGIPGPIYALLWQEARSLGLRPADIVMHALVDWAKMRKFEHDNLNGGGR